VISYLLVSVALLFANDDAVVVAAADNAENLQRNAAAGSFSPCSEAQFRSVTNGRVSSDIFQSPSADAWTTRRFNGIQTTAEIGPTVFRGTRNFESSCGICLFAEFWYIRGISQKLRTDWRLIRSLAWWRSFIMKCDGKNSKHSYRNSAKSYEANTTQLNTLHF